MEKTKRRLFTKEERQSILEKTGCKCGHCGTELDIGTMTVDHVFPLYKGGTNDEYNLIALCYNCNETKSNWVYNIEDYYNYILTQYEDLYSITFAKLSREYKQKSILGFDTKSYRIINQTQIQLMHNMIKRGAKRDKIKDVFDRMKTSVILDRAYPGDGEEIFKLLEDYKDRITLDYSMYTSVYDIVNDIKHGEVYVLRGPTKICGVIAFKPERYCNIMSAQLDAIEETTRYKKKYVLTLVCISKYAATVIEELMNDICDNMLRVGAIPVYFNILSKLYTKKEDVISIPSNLLGQDGTIDFFTTKAISNRFRELFSKMNEVAEAEYEDSADVILSDTEIEELVDIFVYGTDKISEDGVILDEHVKDLFKTPELIRLAVDSNIISIVPNDGDKERTA